MTSHDSINHNLQITQLHHIAQVRTGRCFRHPALNGACCWGRCKPSAQVRAANRSAGGSAQQRVGGPLRHTHSTPSDGDEVAAAAVDQQSDSSVFTQDPEVFFRGDR